MNDSTCNTTSGAQYSALLPHNAVLFEPRFKTPVNLTLTFRKCQSSHDAILSEPRFRTPVRIDIPRTGNARAPTASLYGELIRPKCEHHIPLHNLKPPTDNNDGGHKPITGSHAHVIEIGKQVETELPALHAGKGARTWKLNSQNPQQALVVVKM